MVVIFLRPLVDAFLLEAAGRRHVDLATDNRLNTVAHRFAIKLDGPEHVAVIGHGHGRLLERFDTLEELVNLVRAIQQAIFGMTVKMNEARVFHQSY